MKYSVSEDIRKAETLPGSFYSDLEAFELIKERVFARSWQWLAVRNALGEPGRLLPVTFLEGLLNEPLLLSRDEKNDIHCLSNVCTHRGNVLIDKACKRNAIQCRYHGRRFGLDGSMEYMPGFSGAENFPRPQDDLPFLPLEHLGPFLFSALDPLCSFSEWVSGLWERISWMPLQGFRLDPGRSRSYEINANWALYCENYLEGLHIPFIHKSLAANMDGDQYETHVLPWGVLQIPFAKPGGVCFELPESSPDYGRRVAAYYFYLFPNLMLNFFPWGLTVNILMPQGASRCKVRSLCYVGDPRWLDLGAGADLDTQTKEDAKIVESMQRGMKSKLYERGRFSPDWEQGVHHFQRMLTKEMYP